jgi:hypothetical protein
MHRIPSEIIKLESKCFIDLGIEEVDELLYDWLYERIWDN